LILKHGLLRRFAQLAVLSFSGLCASCYLPLTERYYVPSAEGAKVANTNCAGYPPYAALFFFGEASRPYDLKVYLDQSVLTVIISTWPGAVIDFDPTLIRVEADGQLVLPKSIQYTAGKTRPAPTIDAQGQIEIKTDYLILRMPLHVSNPLDVMAHLPALTVNGEVNRFPEVSFKFKKRTHMVMVVINC
jgi:hypothetical protein